MYTYLFQRIYINIWQIHRLFELYIDLISRVYNCLILDIILLFFIIIKVLFLI
jgi:hypothetical protein